MYVYWGAPPNPLDTPCRWVGKGLGHRGAVFFWGGGPGKYMRTPLPHAPQNKQTNSSRVTEVLRGWRHLKVALCALCISHPNVRLHQQLTGPDFRRSTRTIRCFGVLCCAVLHCLVLYYIVLYCAPLYCALLHCAVGRLVGCYLGFTLE